MYNYFQIKKRKKTWSMCNPGICMRNLNFSKKKWLIIFAQFYWFLLKNFRTKEMPSIFYRFKYIQFSSLTSLTITVKQDKSNGNTGKFLIFSPTDFLQNTIVDPCKIFERQVRGDYEEIDYYTKRYTRMHSL